MTHYAQVFCTVAELIEDLNIKGDKRVDTLWPKIKAASDFLQKEIGWFLPVSLARTLKGSGEEIFYLPNGLLSAASIVDDGNTLESGTDYLLMPDQGLWANGPYNRLEVGENAEQLSTWCDDKDGVVITGLWGLYNATRDTGADVDTGGQAIDATTLVVTDGSKASVGLVVKLGEEQELITAIGAPTDLGANLGAAIADAHSTLITLDDVSKVIAGEIIRVGLEQMKVLDTLDATEQAYVSRGWNQTLATTHADETDVYVYRTFTVTRGVNGTTAAAHDAGVSVYQQCPPDDINFLARQIAGKMVKLAESGYAGRIGDTMTGEAMYQFAFPKDELERIARLYSIPTAG